MSGAPGEPRGIEAWPDAIEAVAARGCTAVRLVVVVRETASTQDHARASGAPEGTAVVAWRQTAGRGRLGRAWADTAEDGVAVTFVLPDRPPESLAVRSAVAAALTVRSFLPAAGCGIKWPNDVVVDGLKAAGVLVERSEGRSYVGIGINVRQSSFPEGLEGHATSLRMAGADVDRLDVVLELVRQVDGVMAADDDAIYRTYSALDRLTGRGCSFLTPSGPVRGIVRAVDPRRGLRVETAEGEVFLPASTTSVAPPPGPRRYGDRPSDDGSTHQS
jgi:BirA family biotin operon repressor/biotin-[acetyl-CoA-carboxylase] ligase